MLRNQNPNTQLIKGQSQQLLHLLREKTTPVSCSQLHINRPDKENLSQIIETVTDKIQKDEFSVTKPYINTR